MTDTAPAPKSGPAIAILEGGPFAGRQFVWRGWQRLIIESSTVIATYDAKLQAAMVPADLPAAQANLACFICDDAGRAIFTLKEVHDRNEKAKS